MLDHMKSRGQKQNVIQPGCDFPPSQCVPMCRASFAIVCVYHRHVLVPAELGQALSVVVRFHLVILSTACHDFAFQVQCFPFRVSNIPNVRVQVTSHHNATSRRCGIHHLVGPVVYPVCRPILHWWGVEPHQQKIELRRFDPYRSSSLLHTCTRRGHFADLPDFAKVNLDGNNEPRVSIRPPSHPIAPLEQSVSSKHTVCHGRAVSAWPFGTGQEDHMFRLQGE